jgi:protein-S-isoprenylcysteine O-methyltransferase Ste14
MEYPAELKKAYQTCRFVGLALVASFFVYLAFEEFARARWRPFLGFGRSGNVQTLRYVLYAAAATTVIIGRLLNSSFLKRPTADGDERTAVRRLSAATILSLVFSEIPALLGLALFLVAGLNRDFYFLLFVSLVLVFIYFPRIKNWEDYLQRRPSVCRF